MNRKRRIVLKSLTLGGVALIALGANPALMRQVWAAWPKAAFDADNLDAAMQALFGGEQAAESDAIVLKAPDIAENGAVVPVSVKTEIANVESITILVENNPAPMAASFELTADTVADVSTRLKMGKTSKVIALVKAEGKLYITQKEVKVTIGGCGG